MNELLRKLMVFPVLLLALGFVSCNDEEEDEMDKEHLVGCWKYEMVTQELLEVDIIEFFQLDQWVRTSRRQAAMEVPVERQDRGTYDVSYGALELFSEIHGRRYIYKFSFKDGALYLDGKKYEKVKK